MGVSRTIGFRRINATVTTAGTAVPLSLTRLFVTDFELFTPAGNAGAIYIGNLAVDNTWIPRAAGTTTNFAHGTGEFIGEHAVIGFDLSKVFIDADSSGDSVVVQYFAGDQ